MPWPLNWVYCIRGLKQVGFPRQIRLYQWRTCVYAAKISKVSNDKCLLLTRAESTKHDYWTFLMTLFSKNGPELCLHFTTESKVWWPLRWLDYKVRFNICLEPNSSNNLKWSDYFSFSCVHSTPKVSKTFSLKIYWIFNAVFSCRKEHGAENS